MFESLCILVTAVFSFMRFCSHSASFLHWSRCLSLFGCVSLPVLFSSPRVVLFVTLSCSYLYPVPSLYQEYLVSPCPSLCPSSCPSPCPASGECVSLLHVSLRFLVWGLFIPVQPQFIFLCFWISWALKLPFTFCLSHESLICVHILPATLLNFDNYVFHTFSWSFPSTSVWIFCFLSKLTSVAYFDKQTSLLNSRCLGCRGRSTCYPFLSTAHFSRNS